MKKIYFIFIILFSIFILVGCDGNSNNCGDDCLNLQLQINDANDFNIKQNGDLLLKYLKDNSFEDFSKFVHPQKGVRFSPYTYIDLEKNNILYVSDFYKFSDDLFLWGIYDGRGDDIILSIDDYIKSYVSDEDYINANEIFINEKISRGNNLNNIDDVYINSQSIEYYFSGFNIKYEGLDWKSLTFVFEKFEDKYYVVGIIHGSWTI